MTGAVGAQFLAGVPEAYHGWDVASLPEEVQDELLRPRNLLRSGGMLHHLSHGQQGTRGEASLLEVIVRSRCAKCSAVFQQEGSSFVKFLLTWQVPLAVSAPVWLEGHARVLSDPEALFPSVELAAQARTHVQDALVQARAFIARHCVEITEVATTVAGTDLDPRLLGVANLLMGSSGRAPRFLSDLVTDPEFGEGAQEFRDLHRERLERDSGRQGPTVLVANRSGAPTTGFFNDYLDDAVRVRWGVSAGGRWGTLRLPASSKPLLVSADPLVSWERELLGAGQYVDLDGDSEEVIDTACRLFEDGLELAHALELARAL